MNKIIHQFELKAIWIFVFLLISATLPAQDKLLNKYGLRVISDIPQLRKTTANNRAKLMYDLRWKIPGILVDLKYAGTDNFMKQALYPAKAAPYLRIIVADSLAAVQAALKKAGLGIKIFDAYRPYSVTEKMWELVKDDRYAADPRKGSGHNRGIAVDLTLVEISTGKELDMGTGFDNFSDTAHHGFSNLPAQVLENRRMLKTTMEKHGFKALETEWWHYYLASAADFELLDIDFKTMKRLFL